ncbi:hypothetical protein MMC27_007388 [Xylographa pallens]|nr:hypothetical protein [Xylographa pallens]
MDEAIRRGSRFTGTVGRVLPLRTVEALEAGTAKEALVDFPATFVCRGNDYYEIDNNGNDYPATDPETDHHIIELSSALKPRHFECQIALAS